jgi:arylsulfatase
MRTIALIFTSTFGIAASAPAAGPSIVLVMPDDAGYGDYSGLGNPIIRTPSVDAFMKQSLLLTQFHASPTCSPCRAALMSGRHEFRCGVTHTIGGRERMSPKIVTLAQTLRSAGYTTGIFGKWHFGDEAAYRPENRGFDEVFIHGSGGIGQAGDAPGNHNINPTLWHNDQFQQTEGYCTDLYFDRAMEWIDEKRKGDRPFFAYIATNAPHAPHDLYEKDYQRYLGIPRVREEVARFYGMVENIDTNFGKLLERLDHWQITEDTLVIYLGSDNGGTAGRNIFNAGMRGGKATPYQGGTRVPCMMRWPAGNVPAGAHCDALTSVVDLYPTLARIAGATLSDQTQTQVEGWDLAPLLENPNADWPDRYLIHHVGRWERGQSHQAKFTKCAIQNSRFTLVNNSELYDLESDPGETINVMADHPEVVAQLRSEYDRWWAETQPMIVNESAEKPKVQPFRELYLKRFGRIPDKTTRTEKQPKHRDAEDIAERQRLRRLRAERRKGREPE